MNERITRAFLVPALLAVTLGGCYRPADTTLYEPGVYKGADDPFLAKTAREEHKVMLRERMQQVQTDR